jgi:hypothetical protein
MNIVAKPIMVRHTLKLHYDVYRLIAPVKNYDTLSIIIPVFEFPLHFYFLVFFNRDILTLNRVTIHLMLASWSNFRDARGLRKLAQSRLICQTLVD